MIEKTNAKKQIEITSMEALKRYYKERNHSYKPAQEASNKLPKGNTQPPKARRSRRQIYYRILRCIK